VTRGINFDLPEDELADPDSWVQRELNIANMTMRVVTNDNRPWDTWDSPFYQIPQLPQRSFPGLNYHRMMWFWKSVPGWVH